ncbi:hypothetical protein TSUD_110020 [Trifolium subterraneum]|uniref:UBX domain-containing protein n=1 Tax=Trifolium subterraneum TaxID=3900 RepID=A0A2Z6LJ49_TRISU|nr:hypothetical protein TSUD_110020 [Trifolium subterraneum]
MATIAEMHQKFGREIRVFQTLSLSASPNSTKQEEPQEEFYDFTAEDYYKTLATKKDDQYLKTRKLQEADAAACRSRMTKAVIRVRFPDNHTLEATFQPSDTIQSLIHLLNKKVIRDVSQDFYAAGFCPGAIVYFSYDVSKGDGRDDGPYLLEEVLSLNSANDQGQLSEPLQSAPVSTEYVVQAPTVEKRKPVEKKIVKPKWLKI